MKICVSLIALTLAAPELIAYPAARLGAGGLKGTPLGGTSACMDAVLACKEAIFVDTPEGTFKFWYFRSYSLNTANPDITRAVIVTHGLLRNAGDYFTTLTHALHNDQDPSLVVIAPHFKGYTGTDACIDDKDDDELYWSCSGATSTHRWDDGGRAWNTRGTTDPVFSYSMIDSLIDRLGNDQIFRNLTKITIAGHSDGGQFTQRYTAGNQIDTGGRIAVKYVIANPGSYMYLDDTRLKQGETCLEDGTCTIPPPEFITDWDSGSCPTYNDYKYGLESRTFGYMSASRGPAFSNQALRDRFISRRVAYVMGELDQQPNSDFDMTCPANAQGMHLANDGSGFIGGRRERGIIFWNYAQRLAAALGVDPSLHTLTIVPGCGHDEFCMFTADLMIQEIMF